MTSCTEPQALNKPSIPSSQAEVSDAEADAARCEPETAAEGHAEPHEVDLPGAVHVEEVLIPGPEPALKPPKTEAWSSPRPT